MSTAQPGIAILSLPDELLQQVVEAANLGPEEVTNLRLVSKRFCRVANTGLQNMLQVIYLEPTRDSLAGFEMICRHPVLRVGIKEIQYVLASFDEDEFAIPRDIWMKDYEIVSILKRYGLVHAAQQVRDRLDSDIAERRRVMSHGEDVAILVAHIPSLPRLERLNYRRFPDFEPSRTLNLSQAVKYHHCNADGEPPATRQGTALPSRELLGMTKFVYNTLIQHQSPPWRHSAPPLNVLAALSSTIRPSVLHIHLEYPMQYGEEALSIDQTILDKAMRHVTEFKLELTRCHGQGALEYQDVWEDYDDEMIHPTARRWESFLTAARSLKRLILRVPNCQGKQLLQNTFNNQTWTALESICFQHPAIIPNPAAKAFFERHRNTLRSVTITQPMAICPMGRMRRCFGTAYALEEFRSQLSDRDHFPNLREVSCVVLLNAGFSLLKANVQGGEGNEARIAGIIAYAAELGIKGEEIMIKDSYPVEVMSNDTSWTAYDFGFRR